MKKEIFEWAILIWTSLLVLLITGWVMIEFYDWKDTIVAAIIAFVGAIIGGSITLIGVIRTIEANQLIETKRRLRDELMFLNPLLREIEDLKVDLLFEVYENRIDTESLIRKVYKKFSTEKQLFDYAQRGSLTIYSELISYKNMVDYMMELIYHNDEIEEHAVVKLISGLRDIEERINQGINNKLKIIDK
ncbi:MULTISPECIES: hypothetical protein [Lysinibacillus]|jgi:hypothetical protein|uniref:hypothetical protein n=1 Tax=Lysinibacillus TaxID=400634 RepID=UPI0004D860A0|nr:MULTISPECIES: hypothetical protein [Lysinibacillus]AJK87671.1 hypothetical protein HR49_11105 [Lysinibacillus fusiformis]KHK48763.1 hypothetical protein PI85_21715 [Lysinibacillus sp. A1]